MSWPRRRAIGLIVAAGLAGGACSPSQEQGGARVPGYATVHDTMPEAIHEAKHAAVERPEPEIARSRSLVASGSRLQRIPGTNDAWLDLVVHRRADEAFATQPDTVALLMNCNADSLVVLNAAGQGVTSKLVLAPGDSLRFLQGAHRIRVYGLRPVRAGQRSETLVRMALGGDLVVRTPVYP